MCSQQDAHSSASSSGCRKLLRWGCRHAYRNCRRPSRQSRPQTSTATRCVPYSTATAAFRRTRSESAWPRPCHCCLWLQVVLSCCCHQRSLATKAVQQHHADRLENLEEYKQQTQCPWPSRLGRQSPSPPQYCQRAWLSTAPYDQR